MSGSTAKKAEPSRSGRVETHSQSRAVKVALEMREQARPENDLLDRLAADPRLPLDRAALGELLSKPIDFVGAAPAQAHAFARTVEGIVQKHPEAARYVPGSIL